MKKSIEFLEENAIPKNKYVVLGCSTGPDSMCLLNILHQNEYKIVCAHVNHNIREESKEEYEFLKRYCKINNIIFESLELIHDTDYNEAYYRKKRYNFYKEIADKYKTEYIMTAHHGDDLIETILMRISRGSLLKGYAGFPKIYNEYQYKFCKPLIFYTKEEIIEYNKKNEIPYYIDKTNNEETYTRNRYRHNLLPFLKKENKEVNLKYLKFSETLEETVNFIDELVKEEINNNFKNNRINLTEFSKMKLFLQKRELEIIFSIKYGNNIDKLNQTHIQNILDQIKKGTNFLINLPDNIIVKREYDYLIIGEEIKQKDFKLELKNKTKLPNGDIIEIVQDTKNTNNNVTFLSFEDIELPLYVRNRKDGDKMEIKNLNGHKKIKNVFIDEKISPSDRETWPIVVDAKDKVIWLPGLRKSKIDSEKNKKYDIILKYTRKGNVNEE